MKGFGVLLIAGAAAIAGAHYGDNAKSVYDETANVSDKVLSSVEAEAVAVEMLYGDIPEQAGAAVAKALEDTNTYPTREDVEKTSMLLYKVMIDFAERSANLTYDELKEWEGAVIEYNRINPIHHYDTALARKTHYDNLKRARQTYSGQIAECEVNVSYCDEAQDTLKAWTYMLVDPPQY